MQESFFIKSTLILNIVFSFSILNAQENIYHKKDYITIVSYNVENLFDTVNDPLKIDDEFLPESANNWNTDKYHKKINDLAQVIRSINPNELPELVGLIEIENSSVLNDLVKHDFLKTGNYSFIHHDSPDERGIDVALIFRKDEFILSKKEIIPVYFDFEPETKTRDILYAKGELNNHEIIHVFVNHWSSRRDGQEISEPKRITAANIIRQKTDSILRSQRNAKIIIMGDFNDEPTNKSLSRILDAGNNLNPKNRFSLYNLMYDKHLMGQGTYNYRGKWNMLDNIIVSQALLKSPGKYAISTDGGQIYMARWMMWDNVKTGDLIPNRTYSGSNYMGGVSDHLPVFLILKK